MIGFIEIIDAGILSSVQDLGRAGYRHAGVPISGAFDSSAFRVGNRVLGNEEGFAAIEMTMRGGRFRFSCDSVVCLTGADTPGAKLLAKQGEFQIPHRSPAVVPAGSEIEIGFLKNGVRAYLCVAGGVRTKPVLRSRSSLVSLPDAGLGSALRAGDRLPIGGCTADAIEGRAPLPDVNDSTPAVLRVVEGAHTGLFSEAQRSSFASASFRVSDQSNRAGVRAAGASLPGPIPERVMSEGALPGYVQVPPAGEPIVLGVDGPTTGGYPVIGCVIEADLPMLAQLGLRQPFRFEWVEREDAARALHKREAAIRAVSTMVPNRIVGEGDDE